MATKNINIQTKKIQLFRFYKVYLMKTTLWKKGSLHKICSIPDMSNKKIFDKPHTNIHGKKYIGLSAKILNLQARLTSPIMDGFITVLFSFKFSTITDCSPKQAHTPSLKQSPISNK